MAAFGSMAVQVDGLIGSHGILPAADYFDQARPSAWPGAVDLLAAADLALAQRVRSRPARALLGRPVPGRGAFRRVLARLVQPCCSGSRYLSIIVAGQVFLGYQWDALLLEAGLLAVLMAPWQVRLESRTGPAVGFTVWLVRWLVFRLMFMSGVVKLASRDPAWSSWSALDFHYETQPLPAWTSWYVHQMPAWFHRLSVGFMFYAELVAPFLIFGPRVMRRVGFASLVLLQLLIAATGNYGFFNLLSVVLCQPSWTTAIGNGCGRSCVRSADCRSKCHAEFEANPNRRAGGMVDGRGEWWWARLGAVLIAVTTAADAWSGSGREAETPFPMRRLADWLEPLRSTNSYGLFAVMTTESPGDHRRGQRRRHELEAVSVSLEAR